MISSAGTGLPGHAERGGGGGAATDCRPGVGGERRDGGCGSDDGDDAGDDGSGGCKGIGGDAKYGEDGSGEGGLLTTTPGWGGGGEGSVGEGRIATPLNGTLTLIGEPTYMAAV